MKNETSNAVRLPQWGSRRLLWLLAAAAVTAGMGLGWEWLQAAGVLSLALSVLPCLAMCAAGLCMNRMAGKGGCHGKAAVPPAQGAERRDEQA